MTKVLDISGQRYARLVALEFARIQRGNAVWVFACDCGALKSIDAHSVRYGATRSCGCLHSEAAAAKNTKHGKSHTPEYLTWKSMRERCGNPNVLNYHRWGGRGIRVCPEWDDFDLFLAHVGPRPSSRHSLDRINNDGNYEPGNVRWATDAEQGRNMVRNHWIEFRGERMIQQDWADRLGIAGCTLRKRLKRWTLERALTEKPMAAEFAERQRAKKK